MDELLSAVRDYPANRWIFWVGAGVSLSPPAALPLGAPLTSFVLQLACGERAAERLLEVWKGVEGLCGRTKPATPFAYPPRLESILSAVAKAEKAADGEFDVLSGLGSLSTVPANANHLLLAHLVARGASVFTTNFDTALQAAFPLLDSALHCTLDDDGPEEDLYRVYDLRDLPEAGQIVHVHGTADRPRQLGATIEQVKRGLSPRARADLDARLAAGAVMVFLGYSASDAFDVTPWFQFQVKRTWPRSRMVFVQHGTYSIPTQARALAAGFGNAVIGNADTTAFLQVLAERSFDSPEQPFRWMDAFLAVARPPSQAGQALATCAVCNELGINVDVIDGAAYDVAKAVFLERGKDPILAILGLAARGKGLFDEERWYLEQDPEGPPDLLYYHYVRGDFESARELALTIDQILEAGAAAGELGWRPYTSMSVHAREFLDPYLGDPRNAPDSPEEQARMERLEQVFRLLSAREFAQVQSIHQVTTALRFQMLFSELHDMRDDDLQPRILRLYAEQAQVQGYVSSWRDFALARILRLRHPNAGGNLVNEAKALLRASHDLAVLIGDDRARQRSVEVAQDLRRAARIARSRTPGTRGA